MTDRKSFVAAQFAADSDVNQLTLSRSVRETFGKGLSFVHVKQLRDAFQKGSFDRVWTELFGVEEDAEMKTEPKKREKKIRHLRTAKKVRAALYGKKR